MSELTTRPPAPTTRCPDCRGPRLWEWLESGAGLPAGWYPGPCESCAQRAADRQAQEARARSPQAQTDRLLGESQMGTRFLDRTLETFRAQTPAQKAVLATCRAYVDEWATRPGRMLLLCGTPGTGKTHLACGILHALAETLVDGVYVKVPTLFRRLKDNFRRDDAPTQSEVVEPLIAAGLLVLDEVGVQGDTEWERITLFDLLNARYENRRSTVFVTNLTFAEFGGVMGDRITDRLYEDGGRVLTCDWPSWRRRTP